MQQGCINERMIGQGYLHQATLNAGLLLVICVHKAMGAPSDAPEESNHLQACQSFKLSKWDASE